MRVYIPATPADLVSLAAGHPVPAGLGFAATAGVQATYGPGDDDEYEHAAMSAAAAVSRERQGTTYRRVVIAADAEVIVRDDASGEVDVPEVPPSQIASVHVDEKAHVASDVHNQDNDDDAADLLWFGVQELDQLIQLEREDRS